MAIRAQTKAATTAALEAPYKTVELMAKMLSGMFGGK